MNFNDFMNRPIDYSGRKDELDMWSQRNFKQQMQDIYGEANRLIKYYKTDDEKLSMQWDVLDNFCAMTYLAPTTTEGECETLKVAEWELYDYVFGENTFRNNDESVMRWFNQWVFDINYDALIEG